LSALAQSPGRAATDARWMAAALTLGERGVGWTSPNPSVGCIVVTNSDGAGQPVDRVAGRGWTQPGGRPHAEAVALAQAGAAAREATAYVTLEPCAHRSTRGATCADALIEAGMARVVVAVIDPDPRTAGSGVERLQAAGIEVTTGVLAAEATALNAGFFSRQQHGRPLITLKLALSLDGCLALVNGASRWITGPQARAHAHLERVRNDMIVVGRGTLMADDPALDVRLDDLEARAPRTAVLSRTLEAIPGNRRLAQALLLRDIGELDAMPEVLTVLVEGGAGVATALLAADRVDRLLIYRAPLLLGGKRGIGDLGLHDLTAAHSRWAPIESRALGVDRLERFKRTR